MKLSNFRSFLSSNVPIVRLSIYALPIMVTALALGALSAGVSVRFSSLRPAAGMIGISVFFLSTFTFTILVLGRAIQSRLNEIHRQPETKAIEKGLEHSIRMREIEAQKNSQMRQLHYQFCFWVAITGTFMTTVLIALTIWLVVTSKEASWVGIISATTAISGVVSGLFLKLYAQAASEMKLGHHHSERFNDQVLSILFFREEIAKVESLDTAGKIREMAIRIVLERTFVSTSDDEITKK